MKIRVLMLILAATALAVLPALCFSEEDALPRLQRNPFTRPELVPSAGPKGAEVKHTPALTLKAILFANDFAMANINGKLIGIGEKIKGYRLLQIDEGESVLTKGGKQIVLTLERNQK